MRLCSALSNTFTTVHNSVWTMHNLWGFSETVLHERRTFGGLLQSRKKGSLSLTNLKSKLQLKAWQKEDGARHTDGGRRLTHKLCLLDCWNCCVVSQTGSCSFWEILLTGNCHASVVTEYVLKLQSMCARSDVCSLVPRLVWNAWHLMWAWCNRNRTRGFRTESQRLCCSTNCAFNALCVWCSSPNS